MPVSCVGAAVGTTGIGWRHPHYGQVLESLPKLGFLEVHSENFFADGGAALATLAQARQHYDISLHGVSWGLVRPAVLTRGTLIDYSDWCNGLTPSVSAITPASPGA